jgi:hypothetical protein
VEVPGDGELSTVGEANGVSARGGSFMAGHCPRATTAHKRSSKQRWSFDGNPTAMAVSGAERQRSGRQRSRVAVWWRMKRKGSSSWPYTQFIGA